jgi:hypothetical protein
MSTDVTMQELELETAELLPSRETLGCSYQHASGHNVYQSNVGYGNVNQNGGGGGLLGNVAVGGGNLDNINVLTIGSGNGQGAIW